MSKQHYIRVTGTECWLKVSKSEIEYLESQGYELEKNKREDGIFVTVRAD